MNSSVPSYELHATIQDPSGDIVIVCPLVKGGIAHSAFKVSKRRLSSQSNIFQDMLEALPNPEDTWHGLPVVHLAESVKTMEIILSAICNLPQGLRKLDLMQWPSTLEVWEAANKYEMYTIRALASKCLIAQIDQRSIYTEILDVHLRATTFDDPELAKAALERFTDYEVSYGRHDEGKPWRGKDLITGMTQKNRLHAILNRSKKRLAKIQAYDSSIGTHIRRHMPTWDLDNHVSPLDRQRAEERAGIVKDLERLCGA